MLSRPGTQALLLAAGRGERLRPLTDVVPKPALPLPGGPVGAWPLEALLSTFTHVAVNASHLGGRLIRQLHLEGRVQVIEETPEPFGTAGTLAHIKKEIADTVFVANSDLLTDLAPEALVQQHARLGARATVAVVPVGSGADFIVQQGRAIRFVDRRAEPESPGFRFMGMSVIDSDVVESLPDVRPLGLAESVLAPLVEAGELAAFDHQGYALDVGSARRYLQAATDVLAGTAPPPPSGPAARPGTLVEVEGGRAWLGPGASVEGSAIEPGAVVFAGARLGKGARVARSIVWPGEIVPAGAVLDGAVWFGGRDLKA